MAQGAGVIEAVVAVTPMETMKTKMIESNSGLVVGVRASERLLPPRTTHPC